MSKRLTIVLLGFSVLFLATACAPKTPEAVVKRMIKNMADVKTVATDFKFGVFGQFPQISAAESEEAESVPGSVIFNMKGDIDSSTNFEYALAGEAKYNAGSANLVFNGDLRHKDNILYLRLTKLPLLGPADLSGLQDNWYKFDFKDFGLNANLSDKNKKLDAKKALKLKKLFKNSELLEVASENGIDILNDNIRTRHYDVKLNKKGFENFFREANEIMEERELTPLEEQDLRASSEKIAGLSGQIWVGEDDYMLYRVEFGAPIETADKESVRYDLALNLNKFDHPIKIEKPADVREFNLAEIFGAPSSPSAEDSSSGAPINLEDKLKDIQGVNPDELKKQLEEIKQGGE